MILVTLGTQKQQFRRLLDYIENSNIGDEIIVQAGHTKYASKKMKIFDFISYDEMRELETNADIIITHGGTGSIVNQLKNGKRIIACARKMELGEHSDNHQEELVSLFKEEGYLLEIDDTVNLDDLVKQMTVFQPKLYKSNTENFVSKLKKTIGK